MVHAPKVLRHWCEICGRGFTKAHSLRQHERTHTSERKFPCAICQRSFKLAGDATRHLATHETREVRLSHTCPTCGRKCMGRKGLKEHICRRHSAPTITCPEPECTQRFHTARAQRVHYRAKHTNENTFLCRYCDKGFRSWRQMRKHVVTHTGEALLNCKFCQRKFVDKHAFADHVRTHTGEKPFKCSQCSSGFARKTALTSHMRSHTDENPFKCDHCEHACSRRDNLRSHMLKIHGMKLKKIRKRNQHSSCDNDFSDGQSSK